MTTTLFSWGYYGWGNATPQLVQAADAVEKARGFEPSLFVDIRIRRSSVRAKGFVGKAFETLLGPARYRWMKSLGNKWVETRTGPNIQIANPDAADDLLGLAFEAAGRRQRLLFFCSCKFPRRDGKTDCHRDTVSDLVLKSARKMGKTIEVIEWPGGKPQHVELELPPSTFRTVSRGRSTIPLPKPADLAKQAGLPWGSVATIRSGERSMRVMSGPARYSRGDWLLPVLRLYPDARTSQTKIDQEATELRLGLGLGGRLPSRN